MKALKPLAASIAVILSCSSLGTAVAQNFDVKAQTKTGAPAFVAGQLGEVGSKSALSTLESIVAENGAYAANGNEGFSIKQQWTDSLGKRHTRVEQTINGLKVYGASMVLHTQGDSVYAVSGSLAVNNEQLPRFAMAGGNSAIAKQFKQLGEEFGKVSKAPELAYVYLPLRDETRLVWTMEVSWDNGPGDFGRDTVFFDAYNHKLLTRYANVHSAKNWKTHTLNGGSSQSAPGQLLCTNNQSCGGNAAAQRAHDGASKVYDYYYERFNRRSLDDNDMTMVSSVDMGEANAYWTGSQMIYGQAMNGMNDFTADFDIIGHELTHGVTQHTANLRYQNASGALNEAWSDILGVSAEAYRNGTSSSSWLLGDGLYNQAGKAFRYMNNPTQDNYSKDWWPERIPYVSNPTNQNDYGGVHGNSGIANLAYVLLVDGGTHPRSKSSAQVPGIGMAKAEQIFYRALKTYMGQSTDFAGARTATAQAATDLYGATEKTAVETAWCAVGVGSCPSTDPTDPTDPGGNVLQNGVAATGLSASASQDVVYTMDVPSGATNISFTTSGGSGDGDLYVKFGSTPTDSSYDCRPYKNGNNETCSVTQSGGKYYVRVKAYSTFSGVSLTGSYTDGGGTGGLPPINDSVNNLTVAQGQWAQYNQDLVAGYASLTISISGGSGDVDLYVKRGSTPSASNYDCRPYLNGNTENCTFSNPTAGRYNIGLYGYTYSSGVTLTVTANP